MVLNISAQNLSEEVQSSEEVRDATVLKHLYEMRARFAAPGYNSGGEYDPENIAFSYAAFMLPLLVYGNPTHTVSSALGSSMWPVSEAVRLSLDRVAQQIQLQEVHEAVALDLLFGFGMEMVTREPVPGDWEPGADGLVPHRPTVYRIAPERALLDRRALTKRECRFIGHEWTIDKDDLIALAGKDGWNRQAIQALVEDSERAESEWSVLGEAGRMAPRRGTVHLYDLWVPETGKLYTIGKPSSMGSSTDVLGGGKARSDAARGYIRDPRAYYGPRSGPYEVFGSYMVPSSPFPISALQAMVEQSKALNRRVKRQQELTESARTFTIVKGDEDFADEIRNNPDRTVFARDEFDNTQVAMLKVGGADPDEYVNIQFARDVLQRNLGYTENQQGVTTGDTATESGFANNAASIRLSFPRRKMNTSCDRVADKMGFFIFEDDETAVPLGEAGEDLFGRPNVWMVGGQGGGGRWEDIEVKTHLVSADKDSEESQQARFGQMVQLAQGIAGALGTPGGQAIGWGDIWQTATRLMHMPELDGAFDQEAAAKAGEVAMQQGPQGGMNSAGSQPQMRMSKDLPKGRVMRQPTAGGPSRRSQPQAQQPALTGGLELD